MKKFILNPISMFIIGLLLGILIKVLDVYGKGFGMELAYMFSDIQVWILLGILISIFSKTKKQAAINIFPFCIGMLITYYIVANILNVVYGKSFIIGWSIFSLFSPLFAYFTWQSKEKGIFSKIISIGIILGTIILTLILGGGSTILDYICLILILYFVIFHKIKRDN